MYFIGIDSGTQSTKAVVVRAKDGKVMGSASCTYGLISGLPVGHLEQDPQSWVDAMRICVHGALKKSGISGSQVLGIGVSGQQHGFVPLDSKGKVIRSAKLWCDTSTVSQCEQIHRKVGGKQSAIRKTGNAVLPGFTASKVLWLKQNEPENFAKLTTILLPHDYLNYWLTGSKVMEYGDASGTALMDVKTRHWSQSMMKAIDPRLQKCLPKLQSSSQPAGTLSVSAARKLGLKAGILVSAGGGDNMMGAIGTGNVLPGIVTASFGTSGTIYSYSDFPVIDPRGEVSAFCDSTGGWLPLVCTMNVTVATEMIRKLFRWDFATQDREVAKIKVGSDGLLLIPYLQGERTPHVPNGKGVFFGIQPQSCTPAHWMRATMEGVTLGMNYGLNRMKELGIRSRQIRVTGGGSRSAVWRQIMADIFNCEVIGLQNTEGAAFGAALQAWWCYENLRGHQINISDLTQEFVKTDPKTRAIPRSEHVKIYHQIQSLQNKAPQDFKHWFKTSESLLTKIPC